MENRLENRRIGYCQPFRIPHGEGHLPLLEHCLVDIEHVIDCPCSQILKSHHNVGQVRILGSRDGVYEHGIVDVILYVSMVDRDFPLCAFALPRDRFDLDFSVLSET